MSPEAQILQLKWHKFQFRLGLRPRPRYESHDAPQVLLFGWLRALVSTLGDVCNWILDSLQLLASIHLKFFFYASQWVDWGTCPPS